MLKNTLFAAAIISTLTLSGCKINDTATANAPATTTATDPAAKKAGAATAQASIKAEPIHWLTIEEAAAKQKLEPRKIVIDVYTDWCGWCKKMDKTTFADPEVAAYVNAHYYAVKLDAEGTEPITLNGHTFKYNPEYKSHELAVALLNGQLSFPTTVYLDEEMKMLTPVPGFMDAPAFSQILRYFGGNHYKEMNFDEFEKM
ncbi:DUF255 domain-containing protein [Pontibacter sp. 172403-2]|uniref:thioredoxin family protein n=1 Tax=Pontibacter rufus TaxID=2791028 RepID=UPI0018AFE190|nr:DUF255 domain-containing protein [Pontibacter sp. 172403-2]MBF9254747.1 DUF255 domain-containing protein [Pontibacter sp. 172403-2]